MNVAYKAVLALVASASCSTSLGQALYYDHRSTAEGDVRSAMADQQAAWGAAARNWAEGYGLYVSAEEQRLAIAYQVYQIRRQVEQDQRQAIERKAETRRRRNAERDAASEMAALQLVAELQMGIFEWPMALVRPEYTDSKVIIDGLLKGWKRDDYSTDTYARSALVTEAGVLRRRVATDRRLPFADRVAAVRMLKLVQRIAAMETSEHALPVVLASNQ